MGKIRGTNSSPGVYTQFTDISYAASTLGITSLGLVGETKKGPAFEPIKITKWEDFVYYFGNTSPEKFKGSQYPKYELPYIAKSYLTTSDQLYVCRVLGLSGYNAGPAFAIYGENENKKQIIAILRSRGTFEKYPTIGNNCNSVTKYDTLIFDTAKIELSGYTKINSVLNEECKIESSGETSENIIVNPNNYGQFNIVVYKNSGDTTPSANIPVSLNPGSKDYILSVLGKDPNEGLYPIFVEELYDVMWQEAVESNEYTKISKTVKKYEECNLDSICDPIDKLMESPTNGLVKKDFGKKVLCVKDVDEKGKLKVGTIYEIAYDNSETELVYKECKSTKDILSIYVTSGSTYAKILSSGDTLSLVNDANTPSGVTKSVYVKEQGISYIAKKIENETKIISTLDKEVSQFNDYKEQFRSAVTPWVVSELKGDGTHLDVKKLFRFYTISDGNCSNEQIKISITNIKPEEGTFDVLIRDFYDSDGNTVILESYRGLTMIPGDSHYIGLKIGTVNGEYELKSKYVMVDIIENDMTELCVPSGFLGYPIRYYGSEFNAPNMSYNKVLYEEDSIKIKNQYFGLSDLNGIDIDMFTYKGKNSYHEGDYTYGYTKPFHMDSTLVLEDVSNIIVTIDGDETTSGITWDAVSPNNLVNGATKRPVIGTESDMEGTIYENIKARKFTVCFYGGFDGWDIYRQKRTNTDEFKSNKYKGPVINGNGRNFSKIINNNSLSLPSNSITTDYYAYLAGTNQFENTEVAKINIFATPGIDYVNNSLLVNDIFDMITEKRGDSLYVVTTPDKPSGSSDATDEMFSGKEASDNLRDTGFDTYYGATYYPWVKYFDKDNNKYIYLPATKDVVRNMADVDNKKYPWYAPAGLERGNVDCVKAHLFTKTDDENDIYDGRINPIKTFAKDGVKVWGNKTMYTGETPMNRINVVRLMLYMRKLITEASLKLIFDQNDTTLKKDFDEIVRPILTQIKSDRGITDFRLNISQTEEQMDAHELSANIGVKPTPTLEYIEINFTVTPQGVEFEDVM